MTRKIIFWTKNQQTGSIESLLKNGFPSYIKTTNEDDLFKTCEAWPNILLIVDEFHKSASWKETFRKLISVESDLRFLLIGSPEQIPEFEREYKNIEGIDFLRTPAEILLLDEKIRRLLREKTIVLEPDLTAPMETAGEEIHGYNDYGHLLSQSKKMKDVLNIINQVAETNITVLVRGESGTGKELVSRTIHARSLRREKPFVKVLCAALPEGLLESELFGYEKGAFTGAHRRKPGKFEFANHGTIFLDEIGEIHPSLQAKLLQVLQDGEFSRIGGENDVKVDTRVITATNKHLEKAVEDGSFREDLYYRLNVVSIHLPPLRERKEEIPFLAQFFFDKYVKQYNKKPQPISDRVLQLFQEYNWPGNVREMENTLKRMVVLESEDIILEKLSEPRADSGNTGETLSTAQIDAGAAPSASRPEPEMPATYSLKAVGKDAASKAEKELIQTILTQVHWNRKKAAQMLHISYKALLYKIKKYELNDTV